MKILALDTATEACSAAIYHNGTLIERYRLAPREHNRIILPLIQELLEEAGFELRDLDAIAFGRGPGSFTGVRIAAGVAQGLALSQDLPLIPISTLASLSFDAIADEPGATAVAAIDARMGEIYLGSYKLNADGGLDGIDHETVLLPQKVTTLASGSLIGVGSGWVTYEEELITAIGIKNLQIKRDRFPRASSMASLAALEYVKGNLIDAAEAEPVYLRNQVANKPTR